MAYIGNTPAENYASFLTETFSVSATANYTLSHAVTNENEIRLVINGVVQQPGSGKAYTASGTTLTLSSATVSGDVMYAVYLGRALQTVNPPNASVGNSQVAASIITGQTAETSIADGDTILIHDSSASALRKMTKANFVSGIASSQAVVYAQGNSGTSCSDNTITKIELENEIIDTASLMASSRFTVTSDYQGKYLSMFQMSFNHTATAKLVQATIRKNNTEVQYAQIHSSKGSNHTVTVTVAMITDMTTNDYLEFWGKHDTGSTKTSNGGTATNVKIFKIN